MKLNHLKYEKCPTCGARIVREIQDRQHSNGEWFETIEFQCFCEIGYIPNFSKEVITRQCPKHPDVIEKSKKRETALEKIIHFINDQDVDEGWKNKIISYIERG